MYELGFGLFLALNAPAYEPQNPLHPPTDSPKTQAEKKLLQEIDRDFVAVLHKRYQAACRNEDRLAARIIAEKMLAIDPLAFANPQMIHVPDDLNAKQGALFPSPFLPTSRSSTEAKGIASDMMPPPITVKPVAWQEEQPTKKLTTPEEILLNEFRKNWNLDKPLFDRDSLPKPPAPKPQM